jgi:hypothetical protein
MGERDRRHPQEQRGVRGGAQVAAHRLRRVGQVLAGEAALDHLPVSRGGLSSPPGVRASPHLSGILFGFWVLFVGVGMRETMRKKVSCCLAAVKLLPNPVERGYFFYFFFSGKVIC